jgi:ribosomal protein L11 methyltransferase
MSQYYLSFQFLVSPLELGSEILIAELAELPFESFEETETGVNAYIQKDLYQDDMLENIRIFDSSEFTISYNIVEIAPENWNETWESNFNPITISDLCMVRAPFHEKKEVEFDIVIEPKMSFGTGHHETTHLMLEYILEQDFENKKTLDMGCGTAVLAILASKKGANPVDAIDIDHWCYLNSIENIERNKCLNIRVLEGDVSLLPGKSYDIIIANINRNILLQDLEVYQNCIQAGGMLLLSGFYQEDIEPIEKHCNSMNLNLLETKEKNNWVALRFIKL